MSQHVVGRVQLAAAVLHCQLVACDADFTYIRSVCCKYRL